LVFDGARLPMKKRTEEERKKARNENRQKAEQFLVNGDLSGANKKFMEAVEITP
jgi:exonuclease-1